MTMFVRKASVAPCDLSSAYKSKDGSNQLSLILFHGAWNDLKIPQCREFLQHFLTSFLIFLSFNTDNTTLNIFSVQVDQDEDNTDISIDQYRAPAEMPALRFVYSDTSNYCQEVNVQARAADVSFFLKVDAGEMTNKTKIDTQKSIEEAMRKLKAKTSKIYPDKGRPLRIFVAGDKSKVGKSTICLGLLGYLLHELKYPASSLAYIKPATQCEETELVVKYCKQHQISHCPIGPLIYYKGFTRAFLDGKTDGSEVWLSKIQKSVDDLILDENGEKEEIIIDGVGYPAVGSITGTDNADVARVCGYPLKAEISERKPPSVLLVGKSGVGDAIDSYNLNSSYFGAKGVPVIGVIFNRLTSEGYYSLEKCKASIESYFKNKKGGDIEEKVFGFVPEVSAIAKSREPSIMKKDTRGETSITKKDTKSESLLALQNAEKFIEVFKCHVDVRGILRSARAIKMAQSESEKVEIPPAQFSKVLNNELSDIDDQSESVRKKVESGVESEDFTNPILIETPNEGIKEVDNIEYLHETGRKKAKFIIGKDGQMTNLKSIATLHQKAVEEIVKDIIENPNSGRKRKAKPLVNSNGVTTNAKSCTILTREQIENIAKKQGADGG